MIAFDQKYVTTSSIDETGIAERVQRLSRRSIKGPTKVHMLTQALGMCDLTTLEGCDTPDKVTRLCRKARNVQNEAAGLPSVAAVCVYAPLVPAAKTALTGSSVLVAAVSTAFPSGMAPVKLKLEETKIAIDAGADEIDMVISRGHFLRGEYAFVFDEIAAVKDVCGNAHLKVILETGELGSLDAVRCASDLAIAAGADFIKTSTGKIQPAATLPVTLVMMQAIRDHYYKTGTRIGLKPAGGISTAKQAIQYLVMVTEELGTDWLSPTLFRFGASRLVNDLLMQIEKQRSGTYQSPRYFSND
jgi:deoxyribose-phosphate aldolase